MKKLIVKILFGLLFLGIVGGSFYWYEFRPMHFRKECVKTLADKANNFSTADSARISYELCLHAKGIAE